jgi:hypothetical protein
MRILVASLLIVATSLSVAQTSQKLSVRYGKPDVERFTVAADIGLTVEYGSDGLACQMVIEKKRPLLHREEALTYMAPEAVAALVDEIVPTASRGREINTLLESMGCAEGRAIEYENVWIAHASDECVPLKPERESRATVAFKRSACPVSPCAQLHN